MNLFNELIKFKNSKEWIEFAKYYEKTSILEQIDFFRFEDANTNFLASLLRENNPYNLKDNPLHLFCELISSKDIEDKFPNIREICISNADLSNINVRTQEVLFNGRRIDLIITFNAEGEDYLIALEAKLYSFEHDQCDDYKKDIDKKYKNYKKIYIYLSLGNDESFKGEENYLKITYQDLIDYVYEPCSYMTDNKNLSLKLNEYIVGFSSLYGTEKDINYIPITSEGKKLTLAVWNNNKNIIKEFLENTSKKEAKSFFQNYQKLLKILFINLTKMNSIDIKIEKEYINTFDTINRIAQNIKERNKLNNSYYTDCEFIYQVFKDIISKVKITDYKQLDKVNEHKFIYSPEEYENAKTKSYHTIDKYGRLCIPENSNNYFYYSINNRVDEIEDLIELIKNVLPEYYNDKNLARLENINELLKGK